MATIGIIGGSGLYQMEGVKIQGEEKVSTPYGAPSDRLILGELQSVKLVFLPRHGRGHTISPSEINYRANIYALKVLGVERILSVSAVGSLQEEIHPGHVVIIDQFFDRTRTRASTFFTDGIVAHTPFGDPLCPDLRDELICAAEESQATVHKTGTYVCIEGPQFSTKAESLFYRQLAASVIGMTNLTEAKLAREAGLCYATLALSTDYDCWHASEEVVNAGMVVEVMKKNMKMAQAIIRKVLPEVARKSACHCASLMESAIVTDKTLISKSVKKRLKPIVGRYL